MRTTLRSLLLASLASSVGCGPAGGGTSGATSSGEATETEGTSGATEGTSGVSSSEPTTGAPADLCACDEPLVHEGTLDLAGLAAYQGKCLVEVSGGVELSGVDDAALLEPLAHLREAGWVWIDQSPGVRDVSFLACLRETGSLTFTDDAALEDLSALGGVVRADLLHLRGVPIAALPHFAPDFAGIRGLFLEDLPELLDLDPVAAWPGLAEPDIWGTELSVYVRRAPALVSVAGLAGRLAWTPGDPSSDDQGVDIELRELPALSSLAGLEPLVAGDLRLVDLPAVTDLSPLAGLRRAGWLVISGLPGLGSLHGLESLERATVVELGGCDEQAGLALTSLAGLGSLVESYRFSLVYSPTLKSLDGAPGLKVEGELELVEDPQLSSEVVDGFVAQTTPARRCFGDFTTCGCLDKIPAPVVQGCPAAWSGGSGVEAVGEGAPLKGTTAFFGWLGAAGDYWLALVVLDASADVALAKGAGLHAPSGGPKLVIKTDLDFPQWIGGRPALASLFAADLSATELEVDVEVSGRLGDWANFDPADPPRLVGTLASDPQGATVVSGPFEAVFCDAFTQELSD